MYRFTLLAWLACAVVAAGCSSNRASGDDESGTALCRDGFDNDDDGKIDCADEGCAAACSDGGLVTGDSRIFTNNDGGLPDEDGSSGGDSSPPKCDCDDGLSCTDDICDASGKCSNPIRSDYCVINGVCRTAGSKNGSQCQVCFPKQSQTSWTPIVGGCKIGNICYANGEKDSSGCNQCDPTSSVSTWTPVANPDCTISGKCYTSGEKDPTGCNLCDPATSSTAWTPTSFDCKIGNNCYANGDKHPSTSCGTVECDSSVTTSGWTIKGSECLIGSTCYPDKARNTTGCLQCIPTLSKTTWSPASYDCKIGNNCYVNGDSHPSPTCTSVQCDASSSTTDWTVTGNECLIGSTCYQAQNRDQTGCLACDPGQVQEQLVRCQLRLQDRHDLLSERRQAPPLELQHRRVRQSIQPEQLDRQG